MGGRDAASFSPAAVIEWDDDPLLRLVQQQRYARILRDSHRWTDHPRREEIVELATRRLEDGFALVPAGSAAIPQTLTGEAGGPEQDIEVVAFLLGVYAVSNAQFQAFADSGGYDELEFWPEEIWPHLIEFKDQTGDTGPRFWRNGQHDARLADHPVAGVSWYEAQAFALWLGGRLPTEAEWQMAASWHISSSADLLRRFPWGDAMDNTRCNVWGSRHGTTVPVGQYPNGAAPNQVLQLIGNVWEWTDTEFNPLDEEGRPVVGEMPMHVVRGGAFDTYFESQATSYFRTGQLALSRTHNTGFRCAMDLAAATWMNEG